MRFFLTNSSHFSSMILLAFYACIFKMITFFFLSLIFSFFSSFFSYFYFFLYFILLFFLSFFLSFFLFSLLTIFLSTITNSSIPSVLNSFFQVCLFLAMFLSSCQPVTYFFIHITFLSHDFLQFSFSISRLLHCFSFHSFSTTHHLSPISSLVPLPCLTFLSFVYIFQYLILSSTEISFLSSSKSTIYFLLFRVFLLFCL
ncbi:unnamed protein product [Acanthosepion pharaonis]|uniref:Uncharacterized protein n=1 Tax=Acanthosepion pharaonis TaxID=158019 RepID=A0A812D7J8_ACAPH|nr:unnamed protein product [Sepia pharaonis]